MVSAKSQKKPADKKSAAKITADEVALPDDGEKRTSREILDEIINVGCQERAAQKDKAESVRHEISREKYETCGYDSGYVMVKYSDGSFEIVEE